MKIKIKNTGKQPCPAYATEGSAGMDLFANEYAALFPKESGVVGTGIHIELPPGYEAQIRPRSGLAAKHGVTVLNAPGTIDSDYRGEIGVLLVNHSQSIFEVLPGMRIAQMVIAKYERVEWEPVEELDSTERGAGGFGSTGE